MASEVLPSLSATATCNGSIEVFPWLKTLPVAPEYHPTLAEFQDPIAYIFKIEKEASKYGICKIIPPVCPNPKKTAISNLNRSLSARPGSGPTFTTRQQQIGFCPRKHRPVKKPVWQSGETYSVQQFEAKAKAFEKNYLKKCTKKTLTPLEIEALYWKATADKPFSVEYANDMPGSAFALRRGRKEGGYGEGNVDSNVSVGETEWNMRGIARSKGSLLKFMKEEIPGVTSPMLYIAMMFSWFAWHVEDHDLHSLNYLHMGAGKTWYGVPRDAALAFEEVIRLHGYGGEANPLVTFAMLGEKTTVMSPEVLINAGVPCCRLVQYAGEFVVTFPRAYHSGFSHGFNCGEASNIATPGWLGVAKDAAIRRASINSPPMVSHFQLLYDLALSSSSRISEGKCLEPRSSRLKDKKKGEGEMLVKEMFMQDVMQNNDLMHILADRPSVVVIPQKSLGGSFCSSLRGGSKLHTESRLSSSWSSPDLVLKTTNCLDSVDCLGSVDLSLPRKRRLLEDTGGLVKGNASSTSTGKKLLSSNSAYDAFGLASIYKNAGNEKERASPSEKISKQGLFSCVTCGILCFSCVAIIQPTDEASEYLITADCSTFKHWEAESLDENLPQSGWIKEQNQDALFDIPVHSAEQDQFLQDRSELSDIEPQKRPSSLGLLALTYANSSDSEDEAEAECLPERGLDAGLSDRRSASCNDISHVNTDCVNDISFQLPGPSVDQEQAACEPVSSCYRSVCQPLADKESTCTATKSKSSNRSCRNLEKLQDVPSDHPLVSSKVDTPVSTFLPRLPRRTASFSSRSDEDSSRMHVFCLQHAVEVQKKLRSIGGANVLLLCHPDYPHVEAEAKSLAEELGSAYTWDDVSFRKASGEDEETIQLALHCQEAIHGNGDWAVKLGVNLFYSANLSRSPLYCKQMPYNFIIYHAFGLSSEAKSPKGAGKGKAVAGKWCGRVWMSSQVHPYLAESDQKQEKEKNNCLSMETGMKPKRLSQRIQASETTSRACRIGEKRKSAVDVKPIAKDKYAKSGTREDSSVKLSSLPRRSNTRIKLLKGQDSFPCSMSSRSKKQFLASSEDEPDPPTKRKRNKKHIYLDTEDVSGPCNSCTRKRKDTNSETEDEPEFSGSSTRTKKRFKVDKENELESSINSTRKKKRFNIDNENEADGSLFTRLKERNVKSTKPGKHRGSKSCAGKTVSKKENLVKGKKDSAVCKKSKVREEKNQFPCDMEGCGMSFGTKPELALHKKNICPVKGCGKKFFSHKYLVQHRRVHIDDRPLKCPWKGCKMSFKWAWARTEHIRVHTGARPYVCVEAGCGQTFRFVSDFSRHKRKTGHSTSKKGR